MERSAEPKGARDHSYKASAASPEYLIVLAVSTCVGDCPTHDYLLPQPLSAFNSLVFGELVCVAGTDKPRAVPLSCL